MPGAGLDLFATCPRGVEPLLVHELGTLGATQAAERKGGVRFAGTLEVAYRACLWSRLANRILLPLARFDLADAGQLYAAAHRIDWPELFDVGTSFAIEVAGHSAAVSHTHYAGLKVKDAIADRFRESAGRRPDVDPDHPGIRIHLHLDGAQASLSLDLAGESLHRRGYRRAGAEAPLKENLAAALLVRAGWPQVCAAGGALLDPLCGSGTLVIEAGLMAADIAPGLARTRYGFEAWLEHKPKLWRELRAEAEARRAAGLNRRLPLLQGTDLDPAAVRAAQDNARRAGLASQTRFAVADALDLRPVGELPGLVVCNPPYGERLGQESELIKLYSLLGATLRQQFGGWKAAVFTGRPDLGPRLGLRAHDSYSLYNGALPCKLLCFDIPAAEAAAASTGGEDFANRLRKNLKHLQRWAAREGVSCYRAYDADLPDYAVAVDLYQSEELHVHVQEYAAPKSIDPVRAEKRLREALVQIRATLGIPAAQLHYKLRQAQKGGAQYEKQDAQGRFHAVEEHGVKLWVNFDDYLDTGLFLDHRPLRLRLQREASGKRFLNLFCYTGAATAHAAVGGARQTVSVDLSNTYLDWAARNLALNGIDTFPPRGGRQGWGGGHRSFHPHPNPPPSRGRESDNPHQFIRADCREWLREQAALARPPQFDLIFCDPPTFSTSKKMTGTLDIQRDHAELILHATRLLAPGGVLYFSTNRRGFKLDRESLADLKVDDITAQTLGEDFKRPPPAHRCWKISHPD
jgi:23S rRNA (guanine2445-N2)-methyltransferase / 23S rRNA (guanine2069-N7)-methyltransferase